MVTNKTKESFLKLSIQVSLDGLSFCIGNPETGKINYYRDVEFNEQLDPVKLLLQIEQQYEKEEELKQPVNEVILVFSNHLYSLVPSKFFDEEHAANYLKYNAKILKTDFIAHDVLEKQAITNVYIPYTNIVNYFFEKYGEFEYKHRITVLLENLLEKPRENQSKMYIYKKNNTFDMVVIQKGELLLCNSFSYEVPEDFLYYVLFTAEQLSLNPEDFELVFLGAVEKDSPLYQLTYKYVKNISSGDKTDGHKLDISAVSPAPEDFVLLNSF